jgi:myo-inositol-1(or 4)-monophosphatase
LAEPQAAATLDIQYARAVGVQAARSAGQLLLSRIDSIREVRHKGLVDLVTDVDVQSEQEVSAALLGAFPTHTILGEEGGLTGGADRRFRWIVDPLDGTTNYTHGFPFFCVSIGLEVDGRLLLGVVYAPYLDELFVAERGAGATLNGAPAHVSHTSELRQSMVTTGFPYERQALPRALRSFEALSHQAQAVRRLGSAALDMCYVACGRFDAYWEHQVKAWDLAAGAVIVTEAGGQLSATDGAPFDIDGGQILATNGHLHPALTRALDGL